MRALRYHGNRDIRLDDVPEPSCRPGWVKIKNAFTGICGSDLHEYTKGPSWVPVAPHCLTGASMPCTLGHEFSGTIVEVGTGVKGVEVGQKVVIEPCLTDGNCTFCKEGKPSMCEQFGLYGYSGWEGGGGLAEYVVVPPKNIHVVPDTMGLDVAALIEPLTVPWRAIKAAKYQPGQIVLVLGAGPIGLMTLLCLQAFGAEKIIVSDPSPGRLELARQLGADIVLDPRTQDVKAESRLACEGTGPHLVVECAGVQESLTTAVQSVRKTGTIIALALWETQATFDPNDFVLRQITYFGCIPYMPGDFQEVISAVSDGRIRRPERLVSARLRMEDAVSKGFEALLSNKSENVKILVEPLSPKV